MVEEARLSRMEDKLDRLTEALNALVRIEERVTTIFKRLDMIDERQSEFSSRLNEVERTSEGRGHVLRFFERIFWIVLTAAVGAAFVYFRGN